MKFLSSILLALFINFSFAQDNFPLELTDQLPIDQRVREGILENGIKYYIQYNQKPEKRMEMRLAVNAGSMQENDNQQGLAHFTEHMCFNGSEHFKKNELIDFIESTGTKFGAHLNAYTSFDETVYMLQIPTDSQLYIDKTFQIFSDWSKGVSFEEEEIDKERGVVIEEWRLGQGAGERMRKQYWPILFKDSRYAERLPIGKKNILENCKYETLREFYTDWYRPDLMSVIIVGDIDVDEMEKKIKEYFSVNKTVKNPRKKELYPVPDHKETLISIVTDKEATSHDIQVIYNHEKIPAIKTVADYRKYLVRDLYQGMVNNRLSELTQRANPPINYGYSYIGGYVRTKDTYTSYVNVKKENIMLGLKTILSENERIKQHGFTQSELDRQKQSDLRAREKQAKESDKAQSRNYASGLVNYFLEGDANSVTSANYDLALYKKYLPGITLEEVNKIINEWIQEGNNMILITGNTETPMPKEQAVRDLLQEVKTLKLDAYVDEVSDEPLISKKLKAGKITKEEIINEVDVTKWTLNNGIEVFLKKTDFKNDEILFYAISKGGTSIYPLKWDGTASFSASIISNSGLGSFNEITLKKKLAGKIVRLSPYVSELYEGLSGSTSPDDLETLFQLNYLYFTQPRKDKTGFDTYMSQMRSYVENRASSPNTPFRDTISQTMSQKHPRRHIFDAAYLNTIDFDKSVEIYKERFADAGDFTFFIVGNFDYDKIKPFVLKYLASLPSTNSQEMWLDLGIRPPTGQINKTIYKGKEPKSTVQIAYTGDAKYSNEEKLHIKITADILKIKLREAMREDKGGVYGVSVYGYLSKYPYEKYASYIYFGCGPENVEDLINTAYTEIKKIQENGPTEKDLNKVKETLKRSRETDLKENRWWSSLLKDSHINGEDLSKTDEYIEALNKITIADIKSAASNYFNDANRARFVLMPEEK